MAASSEFNNREKNFTRAAMERHLAQIEESIARYLSQLDTTDLQEPMKSIGALASSAFLQSDPERK
jgi:hypothetical protein